MKTVFAVTALILCSLAFGGESCPTGQVYDDCNRTMTGVCTPGCVPVASPSPDVTGPTGPDALCVSAYCHPVAYTWAGDFALAQSALGNGYPLLGSAGPCFTEDRSLCPDIFNQAFNDLRLKSLQANRAMSWLSKSGE
jgi:hypothetical protein